MIEEGCYIDNSAGVYTPLEVCLRLADLLAAITGENLYGPDLAIEAGDPEDADYYQILYETEIELEEKIDLHLMEHHGMRLELFEGAYCIVEDSEAEEDE